MKIGDKVRFLNDVGGGVITGFIGNNLVNVENEDGFDIPVPIREVVVVESDNPQADAHRQTQAAPPAAAETREKEEAEPEPADLPVSYRPQPLERRDGEPANVYLCFMPVSPMRLSESDFEIYLINDCNYFADFLFLQGENNAWEVRFRGTLEPNSKMYIETIDHEDLGQLGHLCLQFMFYKQAKPFLLKPGVAVDLRPNLTKFYKYHTFQPNDFFAEKVLTFELIRHDKPVKGDTVQAEELREALLSRHEEKTEEPAHISIKAVARKKSEKDEIQVIDLHASALLETTSGMSNGDILEYQLTVFRKTMEEHKAHKGKKLVFIHGKGNGVLRSQLLKELKKNWPQCTAQDASFREYGFGATMVIMH